MLETMLGIGWAESGGYYDAVGDLDALSDVWGPSVGWFQIRSLRDPLSGNEADRWRVASALRDPLYSARAARAIAGPNGENLRLWTVYRRRTYLQHKGKDYELRSGHPNAHQWNA